MTLQTSGLTYEEYLNGPEIKQRFDIVDGEMKFPPAPTVEHQRILGTVAFLLHDFVTEHKLGEILFAPLDILIQKNPLRTRQPDLLFVKEENYGILGQIIEGAPDLVAEILSPGNSRSDLEAKLADYAGLGVQECWLVSPEARTVEILGLKEANWQRTSLHGLGDQIQSVVLEGLELEVSQLFV